MALLKQVRYISTIEKIISAGHYAGPEGHRCRAQHGHDFKIVVQMSYAEVDETTGWGPDFGMIKSVIEKYDHKNLNDEKPFSLGVAASSENFARVLYDQISYRLGGMKPDWVEVHEGQGNRVRYGDNGY